MMCNVLATKSVVYPL
uniref:Uncharacterized protein n=1 Tax=Arundo donax TaxID=35708 RepID=A0A0A9AUI4_ARUDO